MEAKDYISKIEDIVGANFENGSIDLKFPRETAEEAMWQKFNVLKMQRELRLLQKAAKSEMDSIKSHFQEDKVEIRSGFLSTASGMITSRSIEQQREKIVQEESVALAPLRQICGIIDVLVYSLDTVKRRLEEEIEINIPG